MCYDSNAVLFRTRTAGTCRDSPGRLAAVISERHWPGTGAVRPRPEVHDQIRRGENHEGRNSSEFLSGNRYLQLRQHICDRLYQEGDPRRNLFQMSFVLYGAAKDCSSPRPYREIQQEIRSGIQIAREIIRDCRQEELVCSGPFAAVLFVL